MSVSNTGTNGNLIASLVVNPTTSNHIGTYSIRLAQSNTVGTSSVSVNSIQIIVDCVVTSIAALVTPTDSDRTYTLY